MKRHFEDMIVTIIGRLFLGRIGIYYWGDHFHQSEARMPEDFSHKKILIIAPHPDDEIGIAGDLLVSLPSLTGVKVIYATNGTENNLANYHNIYTQRRKAEAINGLKKVGITNFTFLNREDRYPSQSTLISYKYQLDQEVHSYHPDIIFIPAREGGHCMHDLLHILSYSYKDQYHVYESALYNDFLNQHTPQKVIDTIISITLEGLVDQLHRVKITNPQRFIPEEYQSISHTRIFSFPLTKKQQKKKMNRIRGFTSQNLFLTIQTKFGGKTYSREVPDHDYSRPYVFNKSWSYNRCKIKQKLGLIKTCGIGVCNIDYSILARDFKLLYEGK